MKDLVNDFDLDEFLDHGFLPELGAHRKPT